MLGINNSAAQHMYEHSPHTFSAMQQLFIAMDDCMKSQGKKTWFGRDKEVDAFLRFKAQMQRTIAALRMDGLTAQTDSDDEVLRTITDQIEQFSHAFPTWQRAFIYSNVFFGNKELSMDLIHRLR